MNKIEPVPPAVVTPFAAPQSDKPGLRGRQVVRIHLLGPMQATTYLGDSILPHGKKARAVLGYLCLADGEHVARDQLARLLWDRPSPPAARTNLRQVLHELSSSFGELAKELITTRRDRIRLNVEACWVDALAALALDPADFEVPHDELLALCRGELLEGLESGSAPFDRWIGEERARVGARLHALLERKLGRMGARNNEARAAGCRLAQEREPAAQPPDRLRVGVLPFHSHSSKKEESLAFSLGQEIAAALARFRWFDVIAPISLRPTPSTPFVDEHHLRRMHLNYVLDGTVTGNGSEVHIEVRLMEFAEYARPVWRESFDLPRNELHRLNELVTTRIVGRIDPVTLFIEGQPNRREHYGATGLLLLAIPLIFSMERKKYEEAGLLIGRALETDPDNAMVAAWAAHWHLFYAGQGWSQNVERTHEITQHLALKAIKLDPNNAEALGIYGHICSIVNKDFDAALYHFDRSLRLNPSLAFTWALSAATYCYIGEPELALQRLERYGELAPLDPYSSFFEGLYTVAYAFKGDYERAVIVGRRCVKAMPDFVAGYKPLIASLGHLGRPDEARPYVEKLLSLEPTFTVEHFGNRYPFKREEDRRRYMEGLRLAGIPER
jgi:TolB-like protein/DNA-binding winged helix-turn-helix (wHTH) protein